MRPRDISRTSTRADWIRMENMSIVTFQFTFPSNRQLVCVPVFQAAFSNADCPVKR